MIWLFHATCFITIFVCVNNIVLMRIFEASRLFHFLIFISHTLVLLIDVVTCCFFTIFIIWCALCWICNFCEFITVFFIFTCCECFFFCTFSLVSSIRCSFVLFTANFVTVKVFFYIIIVMVFLERSYNLTIKFSIRFFYNIFIVPIIIIAVPPFNLCTNS